MYHIRSMRAGSGASFSLDMAMFGCRRVGRDPGRFASSTVWSTLYADSVRSAAVLSSFNAVGALG